MHKAFTAKQIMVAIKLTGNLLIEHTVQTRFFPCGIVLVYDADCRGLVNLTDRCQQADLGHLPVSALQRLFKSTHCCFKHTFNTAIAQ